MKHAFIDRIASSREELSDCVDEVTRLAKARGDGERHRHRRHPYSPPRPLHIEIIQPGGNTSRYAVHGFDLSNSGMGVFHGGFIYPESHCFVHVVTHDGETFLAEAKVVRCECIRGRIHFVGIQFAIEIDACDVLGISPTTASAMETVTSTSMSANDIVRKIAALAEFESVWPDVRLMVKDIQRILDGETPDLPMELYASEDHVAVLDDEGKIVRVNPAWCQLAIENGFDGNGFFSKRVHDHCLAGETDAVDPEDVINAVRSVVKGADIGLQVCFQGTRRGGRCYQMSVERSTAACGSALLRFSPVDQAVIGGGRSGATGADAMSA
ncbi:MAG: PilZ domain-containing protein [Phycisphaerales bacterium]|nr:PilZ domain-containing protein [Phycisphaerales bacterium]